MFKKITENIIVTWYVNTVIIKFLRRKKIDDFHLRKVLNYATGSNNYFAPMWLVKQLIRFISHD